MGGGGEIAGQQLADQPDRQDRHQHQAEAVERRSQRAIALAGLGGVAAAEAAAQKTADAPQHDREHRPAGQWHDGGLVDAQAVMDPGRQGVGQRLHEALNCGPTLLSTARESGAGSRRSSVRSMTSLRSLVRRSTIWSARAITTSHCLTGSRSGSPARSAGRGRPSPHPIRARRRRRAWPPAAPAASWYPRGRWRASAAAAAAAAFTSAACSRRPSISTGSRFAWSARVAMRSSWRDHRSTSWPKGR